MRENLSTRKCHVEISTFTVFKLKQVAMESVNVGDSPVCSATVVAMEMGAWNSAP